MDAVLIQFFQPIFESKRTAQYRKKKKKKHIKILTFFNVQIFFLILHFLVLILSKNITFIKMFFSKFNDIGGCDFFFNKTGALIL